MKRAYKALAVLAFAVGAFLIFGAWGRFLPRGVFIDGVDVGGMTRTAAVAAVRAQKTEALKDKELTVCAGETTYSFTYPEFNFTDNLQELAGGIRKKGRYSSGARVYLNGAERIASNICSQTDRQPVEPYAVFNSTGAPFTYCEGSDGVMTDRAALLCDIDASLNGAFEKVTVKTNTIPRKRSTDDVKRETSLLYSFATYFDGDNAPRSSNIALAASKINGTILGAGCTFSFNDVVGPRTAANGFSPAKIISGGQFVEGVGGGVCQVSTTLYNSALLAGLEIEEYHPHSLKVGYVSPSRDAMVSGTYFDLKFKNNRKTPIYIRVNTSRGAIACNIYGENDGVKRSFVSRTVGTIPQPEDIVLEGEEGLVSQGREGTLSEGYLVEERDGCRTQRLIRRDKYAAAPTIRRTPALLPDGGEDGQIDGQECKNTNDGD